MACYCGKVGPLHVLLPKSVGGGIVRRCYEHGKNLVRDIPGAQLVSPDDLILTLQSTFRKKVRRK
jgi:hypothetical protein